MRRGVGRVPGGNLLPDILIGCARFIRRSARQVRRPRAVGAFRRFGLTRFIARVASLRLDSKLEPTILEVVT